MMAYYHKDLQYHEDTTVKRKMTEEDKDFLRKLQLEMNTQDDTGTRDPRFWVIKGTETFRDSDDPDNYGLMYNGETVAENADDVCAYLNENILPNCNAEGTDFHIE